MKDRARTHALASRTLALALGLLPSVVYADEPAPPQAASAGEPAPPPPRAVAPKPAVESPVAVSTRLEPDPSSIGDVLRYEVVAAYPRGVTVNLPSTISLAPLRLVSSEASEPEVTGEGLRKTFTLHLQHFDVGEAEIPSFSLTYVTTAGEVHTLEVPARKFQVASLLANEANPTRRPEDPPISLSYPNTLAETVIYSAAGTLLAIAVLLPLVLGVLRRKRPVVLPPPIPPHELAYRALEELQGGELLARGQFQDYYVELTEVAKGYLQGRFGVAALDRTTEEIRRALVREGKRVAPLSSDEVIAFLQRSDLVKFARFEPSREEAERALDDVRSMVDRSHRDTPTVSATAPTEEVSTPGSRLGAPAVSTPDTGAAGGERR